MKKIYNTPEVEIVKVDMVDICTTSECDYDYAFGFCEPDDCDDLA